MLRHTHPLVKIRESVNPLIAVYKTSRFIVSLVFTGALVFCPIWQRLLLFCLPAVKLFVPSLVLYFSSSFLSSHSLFCCYGDLKKRPWRHSTTNCWERNCITTAAAAARASQKTKTGRNRTSRHHSTRRRQLDSGMELLATY